LVLYSVLSVLSVVRFPNVVIGTRTQLRLSASLP
jgi:hypothetical protein